MDKFEWDRSNEASPRRPPGAEKVTASQRFGSDLRVRLYVLGSRDNSQRELIDETHGSGTVPDEDFALSGIWHSGNLEGFDSRQSSGARSNQANIPWEVLGLHPSTKNRLVYVLADAPSSVADIRRK